VVADFLHARAPNARVWVSQPTWENHTAIFAAAGMATKIYRYFDAANSRLDFDGMLADLSSLAPGDVALLHACCHNPTGVDPSGVQWPKIAVTGVSLCKAPNMRETRCKRSTATNIASRS
jgi:aromatic-amino-acid transaminase